MEKMNLYDNIGDEEEKQSMKRKIRAKRMIKVKTKSFLLGQLHLLLRSLLSILKPLGMMTLLLNHLYKKEFYGTVAGG